MVGKEVLEVQVDMDKEVEVVAAEDNASPELEEWALALLLVPDKEDRKDTLDNPEDMEELEVEAAAQQASKAQHSQSHQDLFFYKCSFNHPI